MNSEEFKKLYNMYQELKQLISLSLKNCCLDCKCVTTQGGNSVEEFVRKLPFANSTPKLTKGFLVDDAKLEILD